MTQAIQDTLALRLGMAAKAVPQLPLKVFIQHLVKELGDPLSEKKLRSLNSKNFYQFLVELNSDIERGQSNQALAILTSDSVSAMQAPTISNSPALEGPVLKIAVTSNNEEFIDGHFGSCLRILVYEANAQSYRLCDVREVETHESGMNRTDYLTDLIRDCQILATLSIGGPAAAKVTNADVHPIKQATPAPAEEFMQRVNTMLAGTPPPWIKKILEQQG